MLKAGSMLSNRYEIIECIGSGGMADVFKALDHSLNRFVAIKIMKREYSEDTTFVKKFRDEAQSAAGFSHPNIVSVYDVGQEEDLYYIVMELVEGITLKSYIERKQKMTVREAVSIAIQISMGLEAAESQRIVHRDIKPQNVIISKEGKAKITDFGIAKASDSENKTKEEVLMGSIHYTAPELIQGEDGDVQSDIYSLGITIYEMLTGTVAFDGKDTVSVAMKHIKERMPFIRVKTPEVPISLEAIVQKCTEKRPKDRYQEFGSLIRDLKQSLATPDCDFVNGELIEKKADAPEEVEEQEPEIVEESKRSGLDIALTIVGIIAAVMVIIMVALGVSCYLGGGADGDKSSDDSSSKNSTQSNGDIDTRTVIDVRGMTYDEAKEELNEINLGIKWNGSKESSEYESGQIIEQEPESGEVVDVNTPIRVIVSTGATEEEMLPSLVDISLEEAENILREYDLKVGEVSYKHSESVEMSNIISQNPEAGTVITPSTQYVDFVISRGPESREVEVPNVKGISEEEATSKLKRYGFVVTVQEANSNIVEKGMVIGQNYDPGTKLAEGATVTITVSSGAESEDTTSDSVITKWSLTEAELPEGFTEAIITIELTQSVNGVYDTKVVFNGMVSSDDLPKAIYIPGVRGVETGDIEVFVDDLSVGTYTISFSSGQ